MRRWRLLVFLIVCPTLAQTPGNCAVGQASGTLDASGVEVTYPMTGGIAYGPGIAQRYYVPKNSRLSPLYAANIWVGGTVEGEFRVAGTTYGLGGPDNDYFEFWPGPLDDGATLPNPADCSEWDRIWVVSVGDVEFYEQTGVATDDLRDWPVGLGAGAVDASGRRIEATRRGQTLRLGDGERPVVFGTQTAFWVLNDVGNEHRTTESRPLGIEVAVTAWVVSSPVPIFDQSSFMRYRITNRRETPIEDLRFTMWTDPDLGYGGDDFVGVDTTRSLAYVYNADEPDDGSYGSAPPAFGVRVMGGEAAMGDPHRWGSFFYASGGDADRGDPSRLGQYENVMRGFWRDGTPVTARGNGYNQGGEVTTFTFPGDPTLGRFWSEERTGRPQLPRSYPSDRRFWGTTRPVPLPSGASTEVDLAFVFAQGDSRLGSVYDLFQQSDLVQEAYDDGSLFQTRPRYVPPAPAPPILISDLVLGPNPASGTLTLRVRLVAETAARLTLFDALGRRVEAIDQALWPSGETALQLDISRLSPGQYLARLDIRGQPSITRQVTILR